MAVKIWDDALQAFKDAEPPLVYDEGLQAWKESTGLVWNDGLRCWEERWRPEPNPLWLIQNGTVTGHGILSAEPGNTNGNYVAKTPEVSYPAGLVAMRMPVATRNCIHNGYVYLAKGLDVTNYRKVGFNHGLWRVGAQYATARLYVGDAYDGLYGTRNAVQNFSGTGFDVSGIVGKVDVRFLLTTRYEQYRCDTEIHVSDLWLEK